ncbi:Cytochrome P450 [Quillaja saponaria]|uniref:Cytochrome P450 n=1 Tax=Quillaja saponaria TaxID=32244 RepID=A0AAD7P7M3_QUISA|nr:Cytochrome P450 [Quillaja saponaria]
MDSYVFLLVSSLFIFLLCNHIINLVTKKRKLPPGPTGFPIIGNLLALGDRPHESLTNLAKTHGPLMTVYLGFNTTIVASSAEIAREILQTNDQAFLGRPLPYSVTGETNYELSIAWLSGNANKWKILRKLCSSQIFTTQKLDALQGLRLQMTEVMVKRVMEASKAGEAINIGKLVFGTVLNLLSNTLFTMDISDMKSNYVEELKELVWKIMELAAKPNLCDYFPFLKPFDLQHIRRDAKVSHDGLQTLLNKVVERRMERRESLGAAKCGDVLDVLLDHSQQYLGHEGIIVLLTVVELRDDCPTNPFMKTWTGLIHWRNRHYYHNNGMGNEKDILSLPYLQSVLKETMRLHTTAPFLLPHRAEKDVQVCGYTIRKHSQVFVNAWAIARDQMYWDKPTEFIPERFMGSFQVDFRGTNFSFIPFGSGRRICPGMSLAVRMLSLTLASLIHHFDWKLPDGMAPQDLDMGDKFGITLQKAIPLVAIPLATTK